ncbi:hypothetical protein BGZ57DRAFT_972369 [Hyaloscypha finlandica]|nr:hypothetical protein BGZ57DRAFT_972369 [Hyaloscypha finlandica]
MGLHSSSMLHTTVNRETATGLGPSKNNSKNEPQAQKVTTPPRGWIAYQSFLKQQSQHRIWVVISTTLRGPRPMGEVEGVYSRIELAQIKRLELAEADLRAGVQVDLSDIEPLVSTNRLSSPDLKAKRIGLQTLYSNKAFSGSVHTVISTQIMNGIPFVTIEGMYENSEDAQNRKNEIRDWYIENVSKEAKTAGFEMSLDHRAHYYSIPGQNDLRNAVWTGPRTWLPQMRSQYYDIPPGGMVYVRIFVNSIDDADGLLADHPLPRESVSFQGNHMRSRLDPGHLGRVHVSAVANGVRSSFSYPASMERQSRKTVNCRGCGCGEYNCDSCWCQCNDDNCDGPHPENQSGDEEQDEEDDEGEESEDEAGGDESASAVRILGVDCHGCGCGNPRCGSCY